MCKPMNFLFVYSSTYFLLIQITDTFFGQNFVTFVFSRFRINLLAVQHLLFATGRSFAQRSSIEAGMSSRV
jgi:hypothetical protein